MESRVNTLKKFLSISFQSKETFPSYYCKFKGKEEAKQLYILTLKELWKAVTEGKVRYFKNLSNLIVCIINVENEAMLKDFCNDTDNPFKSRNLIILACKYNKAEILRYVLGNFNILRNSSTEDTVSAGDLDEAQHNAFYYAIRSCNVELLEILINVWPENYFAVHSEELEDILSIAYEELKLKNVSLSHEMELFVEDKLMNLRFFSDEFEISNIENDLGTFRQRVQLVLVNINLLISEYYSYSNEIDERFIFIAKFIVQNIHVLKQMLKSTYDKLPWEEIEFCLVCFISSHIKQQELNLFTHIVLNKRRILDHLQYFSKKLEEDFAGMQPFKSIDVSNIKREEIIHQIVKNDPPFQDLYNDYQQIRDVHSLHIINSYIHLASTVDLKRRDSHILITRILQVIGEHLKNTVETPKLSSSTSQLLLLSLPKNCRDIITKVRNSLSHTDSLSKRIEIDNNMNTKFFLGVQNDIMKVGDVIRDNLYREKIKTIRTLLKKVSSSETSQDIIEVSKILKNVKLDQITPESLTITDHEKLENLLRELSHSITDKTRYEQELFDKIYSILNFQKHKFEKLNIHYVIGFAVLKTLNIEWTGYKIDDTGLRELKFRADTALRTITPEIEPHSLRQISLLVTEIFQIVITKMRDNNKAISLIWEIFNIAEYGMDNIKWIDELRERLNDNDLHIAASVEKETFTPTSEKYYKQLKEKVFELRNILQATSNVPNSIVNFSSFIDDKKVQSIVEMLVLDIMSILDNLKCLGKNLYFLNDASPSLLGKRLRNHLAHNNTVVGLLLSDPLMMLYLNARKLTSENLIRCKKMIGKFVKDDPLCLNTRYNQSLFIVTNQMKMFLALEEGNLQDLQNCLKQGADINARNFNSWTALHFACKGACLSIVKFILEQISDITGKDDIGQNPLHIAARYGKKSIVEFWVKEKYLNAEDVDKFGKTPLHTAAQNGHKDVVEVLLKYGTNTLTLDRFGHSPLDLAIRNVHIEVVKVLLEEYANVDLYKTTGRNTPLHKAAERGNLELVNYLIQNGANVNAKSCEYSTPLHDAALNGNYEVVNVLILKGAEVNAIIKDGLTPLCYAVEYGHEEVVNILLQQGANVNAFSKTDNSTPLHYAAQYGYDRIVKLLLQYKANVKAITVDGMTPLHLAAIKGHVEIVDDFIEHGVDINARNKNYCTPLHCATEEGQMVTAKLLLKNKALVNAKDVDGFTPLHIAALKNYKRLIELLVENNAEINIKSNDGMTPLHAAAVRCDINIVNLFIKNKAEVNATNNLGQTPLYAAASYGKKEAVDLLLKSNAFINSRDFEKATPLHAAALMGHTDVLTILIKNKAEVNARDTDDITPLHDAVKSGCLENVEILISNGADINSMDTNKKIPLLYAVGSNWKGIVEYIILNTNVQNKYSEALSLAVNLGFIDIVKLLLRGKGDINVKYEENFTVLHMAAERGHTEIVKILMMNGCIVDAETMNGVTPLLLTSAGGYEETVEALIANGANVNVKYINGTPLHMAAIEGHTDVVKVLLENKANPNVRDYLKRTPLELAVAHGHLQIVKMLRRYTTNVNTKGVNGRTLLHIAAHENNLEMIKYLVNKGADINAKNATGAMPIHIAAGVGFKDSVEFLLSKGSNINVLGFQKQTILHYATTNGKLDVINYLIAQNADVNAKDYNSITPIHIAANLDYKDVTEILLKNGAVYNSIDKFNQKASNKTTDKCIINLLESTQKLFEAVKLNNPWDVENFIKEGAVVNAKNAENETPLLYAARKGYISVVNILLQNSCNANAVDSKGFTPLHYASKFSHLDIVKALLCNGAIFDSFSDSGETPCDLAVSEKTITLFKLVDESFKNVKNKNCKVIKNIKKIKDIFTVKAVMNACNKENKTLIVVALNNNFPNVRELKEILQDDVSSKICTALAFSNLQNFEKALCILQSALERRTDILGSNNPGTLDIKLHIANVLFEKRAFQEALDITDDIFQKQKQLLGSNYKDTLSTRIFIALLLRRLRRYDEALNIYQEVYAKQVELLGPNDIYTLKTQFLMASLLNTVKRYEEALCIYQEVSKRIKDAHVPFTYDVQNSIAMVLSNLGKFEESLKMYKEILEERKFRLGLTHSNTLETLKAIAGILLYQNRYSDALIAYEELVNIQKNVLGLNHADTLNSQYNIGNALLADGKWVTSLKLFKNVMIRGESTWGINHSNMLDISEKIELINYRFKLDGMEESDVLQQTALNIAAEKGDTRVVEFLLRNGADANNKDVDERSPLYYAVRNGHVVVVNILLNIGCNVTQITKDGHTLLHIATSKGHKDIVAVLLQCVLRNKLSFINAQTMVRGDTALHVAAIIGSIAIVMTLLEQGATYNIQNLEKKTPCCLATNQEIINFFDQIETIYEYAKEGRKESIDILKSLLRNEFLAITNARNNQGNTLLQVALLNKHKNIAIELSKMLKEI